jgi:hypothetical protein
MMQKYPNGLLESQEDRQSLHLKDAEQISQNNKNYSIVY